MTTQTLLSIADCAPLMGLSKRQASRRLKELQQQDPDVLVWSTSSKKWLVDVDRLARLEGHQDDDTPSMTEVMDSLAGLMDMIADMEARLRALESR